METVFVDQVSNKEIMDLPRTTLFASSLKPYNYLKMCGPKIFDRVVMFSQHSLPYGDVYIIAALDDGKIIRVFPNRGSDQNKRMYTLGRWNIGRRFQFNKLLDMKGFHHGHVFLNESNCLHFYVDRDYWQYSASYLLAELFFNSRHQVVCIQTSSHIMLFLTKNGQIWLFINNSEKNQFDYPNEELLYLQVLKNKEAVQIACSDTMVLAYTQNGDLIHCRVDDLFRFKDQNVDKNRREAEFLFNQYDIENDVFKCISVGENVIKVGAGQRMAFVLLKTRVVKMYDMFASGDLFLPHKTIDNVYDLYPYKNDLLIETMREEIHHFSQKDLLCGGCIKQKNRLCTDSLADTYAKLGSAHFPFIVNIELAKKQSIVSMSSFFNTPDNYDMKIIVENRCIYAHRWFLTACNDFFRIFLNTLVGNQQKNCIRLDHVCYETVLAFIKFLYTGQVECASLSHSMDLIQFAQHSFENRLVRSCSLLVPQWLNKENYQQIYDFSINVELTHLQDLIKFFCQKHGLFLNESKFVLCVFRLDHSCFVSLCLNRE